MIASRPAIRALLFDGDGVVLTGGVFTRALAERPDIDVSALQPFFRNEFVACLEASARIEDALPPYLDACGWSDGVEAFLHFWFEAERAVDAELLDLICRYRANGVQCHLASNQERRRAAYLTEEMGLGRRFERLFFSCELGVRKPARAYFDAIAQALAPLQCCSMLLWDDAVTNVEAARSTGMQAELYTTLESFTFGMARYRLV